MVDKQNKGKTNNKKDNNDELDKDLGTILRESTLLTTVSGFLFGFLLNISINTPKGFTSEHSIILLIALFSITFAISLFVMPVIYHHFQYPYTNLEKFRERSHRFMVYGIVPGAITLYLGLVLGLDLGLKLGIPGLKTSYLSFLLAIIPFIFTFIVYRKRK
ncbi:MAG: DUF6328 family protein [Candidatus Nitrosocosmicus sp.]